MGKNMIFPAGTEQRLRVDCRLWLKLLTFSEFWEGVIMNIYVGNLSWGLSEDDLREKFESYGEVDSVKIIQDKMTGRSRGFGFVEMPNDSEGKTAIAELNGKELDGRAIKVNEARPKRDDRGGRGFGRR
jgi:RNA recognition motif-containing protein